METLVTGLVLVAIVALGALLIHRLYALHGDRIAAFHYGGSGMPVAGPPGSSGPSRRRKRGLRRRRRIRKRDG
ncbi:hypothetical protein ACIHIX_10435 [Streptomyces sp. NPDC051913]|uniref:hypothetical protein n=1 Tax=Streptomyces sp. NPDC051913 TaxID=3365676 RepID=UPI0037CD3B55